MHRSSLATAAIALTLLALGGCRESPTTLEYKAPPVGQKTRSNIKVTMTFTVDVGPSRGKPVTTRTERTQLTTRTTEVLSVTDRAVTKVKVTYAQKADVSNEQGKEQKSHSPIEGKAYLVEFKGGALHVTDEAGGEVPETEAAVVKADHPTLGTIDTVARAIPKGPLKKGEKVPELGQAILEELTRGRTDNANTEITDVEVKLREEQESVALFDVAVVLTQRERDMKLRIELAGTLGLRKADAQRSHLSLEGPVSLGLADGAALPANMKIDGKGDMSLSHTRTWL